MVWTTLACLTDSISLFGCLTLIPRITLTSAGRMHAYDRVIARFGDAKQVVLTTASSSLCLSLGTMYTQDEWSI
ncbi:hypothetical protein EDD16DRAFT_1599835, partial [Pisolithus croceorrhizus]